jgi:hypothetical protein
MAAPAVKDLGPLETSPQDDRSYRAIELPNGLQVRASVLVSFQYGGRRCGWGLGG